MCTCCETFAGLIRQSIRHHGFPLACGLREMNSTRIVGPGAALCRRFRGSYPRSHTSKILRRDREKEGSRPPFLWGPSWGPFSEKIFLKREKRSQRRSYAKSTRPEILNIKGGYDNAWELGKISLTAETWLDAAWNCQRYSEVTVICGSPFLSMGAMWGPFVESRFT